MSSKKLTKGQVQEIVDRALIEFDLKNERGLADILEISEQNKTKRKNSGSIVGLIERQAYRKGKDVSFILHGIRQSPSAPQNDLDPDQHTSPDVPKLLAQTTKVLLSKSEFSKALETNIVAFAHAIDAIEDLEKTKTDVRNLTLRVSQVEKLLLERQEDCEENETTGGQPQ